MVSVQEMVSESSLLFTIDSLFRRCSLQVIPSCQVGSPHRKQSSEAQLALNNI